MMVKRADSKDSFKTSSSFDPNDLKDSPQPVRSPPHQQTHHQTQISKQIQPEEEE
jgi:hypothetical protein